MSCAEIATWAMSVWASMVVVGLGLVLMLPRMLGRPSTDARTTAASHVERETRRVRAGAPPAPAGPTSLPPNLTPKRRGAIDREARITARQDYGNGCHSRANPYPRHSREFVCWAMAYGEAWLDLEIAARGEQATQTQ